MIKTILITGCSTGIGLDAARALHMRGWRVFATCRAESDCERLRSEGLESFVLDYEDTATISAAVKETLNRTGGTLDALFNNGAYAIPGALEDLPVDALRTNFEANFFGWHELTRQVIPAMRSQGHGRIINCSSVLGFVAMRIRGSYNASKFALEGWSDTLRLEMRRTGIDVILIEPGPITTEFRRNARKQFDRWIDWENSPQKDLYEKAVLPRMVNESGKTDTFELPASAVTKKLIHALESGRPRPRYFVTTPTYALGFLKRILPTKWLDRLLYSA